MEKYGRARQTTDGNMAHALCMLGTQGYNHALSVITAFPRQLLYERVTMLRNAYIACVGLFSLGQSSVK